MMLMLRFLLQHRIQFQHQPLLFPKQSPQIQTHHHYHHHHHHHHHLLRNYNSTPSSSHSFTSLLESYHFTPTQVSSITTNCPQLLTSKLETSIKPKLHFLFSLGFDPADLTIIISSNPMLLRSSLNNRLKPNFIILASIFPSLQQMAVALRRNNRMLQFNLKNTLLPNITTLQSYGVPQTNIAKLVRGYPRTLILSNEHLTMVVETIKKMGFNPKSTLFVHGVRVMCGMRTSKWEGKVAVFKSLGFSEGEISTVFTKQPGGVGREDQEDYRFLCQEIAVGALTCGGESGDTEFEFAEEGNS